jgi:hypothetical protein
MQQYPAGIDDAVILPLVAVAVALKKILKAALTVLIDLIDFAFPILLQVARFPLFTLRILGDGLAALAKGIVQLLPVGGDRRAAWRDYVSRQWAWVRQKLSYKAFEEWLHHAFESGMAWVFRKCKGLSPRAALLVLFGAVLWLPVSFGVATALHAILFAKALVWPAWLQLLHPFATVIAKSKLLVLPVYPAAWPRAKEHPAVQAAMRFGRWLATLYLLRKTGHRFHQTEHAANRAGEALAHASMVVGLTQLWAFLIAGFNATVAWISHLLRVGATGTVEVLSKAPLIGGVIRRYADHYDAVSRQPAEPFSERVSDFYARWSVKFTAAYYEDRERAEATKGHVGPA